MLKHLDNRVAVSGLETKQLVLKVPWNSPRGAVEASACDLALTNCLVT